MNTYTISYYESKEAMKPTSEQVTWAERYGEEPNYNWDNIQYIEVQATTLGGAYRAFTMSVANVIVVGIEDKRAYKSYAIMG